jgi:hypothetical protein
MGSGVAAIAMGRNSNLREVAAKVGVSWSVVDRQRELVAALVSSDGQWATREANPSRRAIGVMTGR